MKLPKSRYNIVIPQRGMQGKCIQFDSTLYEYFSLIERAKCRSPRYIMASLKKIFNICGGLGCRSYDLFDSKIDTIINTG